MIFNMFSLFLFRFLAPPKKPTKKGGRGLPPPRPGAKKGRGNPPPRPGGKRKGLPPPPKKR